MPSSRWLLQYGRIDRHLAQSLPRCRKYRVGDRRHDRRRSGFTNSARRLLAAYNVDFDCRRLIDAQHLVRIEIALFDTPVFQRDFAIERGSGAEDDSALQLRLHSVRIDHSAAIDRADHTADANGTVFGNFDLSYMRHVAAKGELQRYATPTSLGQGLAQISLFRVKVERCLGARRFVEQCPAIGDRILFRGGCQLVDKAFGDEGIVRGANAAPESGRNARGLHAHEFDMEVRQVVDQIDRTFRRVGIKAVLEARRQPARDHRRAGETIVPGNGPALGIQSGGYAVNPIGAIHVVLDILLTRPDDLHGAVDMLRDLNGTDGDVRFQPPAKPATEQMIVDDDLLRRQAGGLRRHRLNARNGLTAD